MALIPWGLGTGQGPSEKCIGNGSLSTPKKASEIKTEIKGLNVVTICDMLGTDTIEDYRCKKYTCPLMCNCVFRRFFPKDNDPYAVRFHVSNVVSKISTHYVLQNVSPRNMTSKEIIL